jgi:integrase
LDLAPERWFNQELPKVPVNDYEDDERASSELVQQYVGILRSMGVARSHGIDLVPVDALSALDDMDLVLKERTKGRARFTTLPFSVASALLADSIAFFLEYGEELVNYYLALARNGQDVRGLPSLCRPSWQNLESSAGGRLPRRVRHSSPSCAARACLHNMLEVLLGAIAVLVNTLMARRASELVDLRPDSIVEKAGMYFLGFDLRKANVLEHRKRMLRPMPTLAAEALQLLARLSQGLGEMGYPIGGRLFEVPFSAWNGARPFFGTTLPDLHRCFDRFCDYHEVNLDEQGRRYYVRAHQLRRNFAMLFFWHGSFGGVEVLRHFLGHSSRR